MKTHLIFLTPYERRKMRREKRTSNSVKYVVNVFQFPILSKVKVFENCNRILLVLIK